MTDSPFAQPIGLSRDPYWDDAWTDKHKNKYVLPHPDNPLETWEAGRASELGKQISNTFSLNRWHRRQVLKGAVIRRSIPGRGAMALYDGLSKRAQDKAFDELADEAEDVAGTKEPAAKGTIFHKLTELYDAGKIRLEEVPEPWDRDMIVYAEVLRRMGIETQVGLSERIVGNRLIDIVGRYDRLWPYKQHCNRLHVGDLKTGRDLRYGWHEIAVQIQVYASATHMFHLATNRPRALGDDLDPVPAYEREYLLGNVYWSLMPDVCQEIGLIMHVPSDGVVDEEKEPTGSRMAALYEVDLTTQVYVPGTALAPKDLAIAVQQWRRTKRLQTLRLRVEVLPDSGEVRDVPHSVSELIDLCESRQELEELWDGFKMRGEWKGYHTRRARERLEILST